MLVRDQEDITNNFDIAIIVVTNVISNKNFKHFIIFRIISVFT